jgi:flagellar biosynthetic protein FlhB
MADESDLEKTESATPKRLEQAREEGQVARSRELTTFALLATGFGGMYAMGGTLSASFASLFRGAFTFGRSTGFEPDVMLHHLSYLTLQAIMAIMPILAMLMLAALLSPMALGGWLLTAKPLGVKFERLNPVAGLGKMFSMQSLTQLGFALAKSLLVGGVAVLVMRHYAGALLGLVGESVSMGLSHTGRLIGVCCVWIVASMLVLVTLDVPYQLWQHAKKLRMTKEEVKREFKESEGDPFIKGKIRAQQREMARRRMMAQVPKADVIVTNPTHFAVALQYQDGSMKAPRLLAKGSDLVAARIREIGAEHNIPVLEAPPLARALFHHTELNQEIPAGLYGAVAEVLAWVYQLRRWRSEGGVAPDLPLELPIPPELAVAAEARGGGVLA